MATAETTFTTGTVLRVLSTLLGAEFRHDRFGTWKARGWWPLEEQGRGWTKYSHEDIVRLFIMAELSLRKSVDLEAAHAMASADQWPSDARRRFLVMTDGEPMVANGGDLAHLISDVNPISGGPMNGSVSALIVDVVAARERVTAALRELGEDPEPASTRRARAAR